jgi:DeoR/GlpR family transcriptional regulator of sugar metabolism
MALSLHVALALAKRPGDEVLVPGGPIDHDDLAFTSSGAVDAVRAMRYDVALISTCAADPRTGLTVERWGDAQVKRAALTNARRVILLATPDKFGRTAAHAFARMADIDLVITTDDTAADVLYEIREQGPEVLTVHVDAEEDMTGS